MLPGSHNAPDSVEAMSVDSTTKGKGHAKGQYGYAQNLPGGLPPWRAQSPVYPHGPPYNREPEPTADVEMTTAYSNSNADMHAGYTMPGTTVPLVDFGNQNVVWPGTPPNPSVDSFSELDSAPRQVVPPQQGLDGFPLSAKGKGMSSGMAGQQNTTTNYDGQTVHHTPPPWQVPTQETVGGGVNVDQQNRIDNNNEQNYQGNNHEQNYQDNNQYHQQQQYNQQQQQPMMQQPMMQQPMMQQPMMQQPMMQQPVLQQPMMSQGQQPMMSQGQQPMMSQGQQQMMPQQQWSQSYHPQSFQNQYTIGQPSTYGPTPAAPPMQSPGKGQGKGGPSNNRYDFGGPGNRVNDNPYGREPIRKTTMKFPEIVPDYIETKDRKNYQPDDSRFLSWIASVKAYCVNIDNTGFRDRNWSWLFTLSGQQVGREPVLTDVEDEFNKHLCGLVRNTITDNMERKLTKMAKIPAAEVSARHLILQVRNIAAPEGTAADKDRFDHVTNPPTCSMAELEDGAFELWKDCRDSCLSIQISDQLAEQGFKKLIGCDDKYAGVDQAIKNTVNDLENKHIMNSVMQRSVGQLSDSWLEGAIILIEQKIYQFRVKNRKIGNSNASSSSAKKTHDKSNKSVLKKYVYGHQVNKPRANTKEYKSMQSEAKKTIAKIQTFAGLTQEDNQNPAKGKKGKGKGKGKGKQKKSGNKKQVNVAMESDWQNWDNSGWQADGWQDDGWTNQDWHDDGGWNVNQSSASASANATSFYSGGTMNQADIANLAAAMFNQEKQKSDNGPNGQGTGA